eukprot:CAMPEP_0178916654 /NCGR_PEP_ID=MMETSP0786-20121207/12776_1 /TAXON_ID=186022 /ORGANISM="Thalassionema frauenfeldii, Strain CCMP 1798" /LENGTH=482 /DNA_ID=CAMNT_0020590047 /DNA_START=198 /DNA_END=1646 /DNA_ORIENTATION=+
MGLDLAHVLSPERHYSELQCAVCNGLTSLDSYVTATCSHPICKGCLDEAQSAHCPMCFEETGGFFFSLKQAQPLALRILGVKVACPYRHSCSDGKCTWAGDYQQLQKHIEQLHPDEISYEEQNQNNINRESSLSPPHRERSGGGNRQRVRRRHSMHNTPSVSVSVSRRSGMEQRERTRKSRSSDADCLDRGSNHGKQRKDRRDGTGRKSSMRSGSKPGEPSHEQRPHPQQRRGSMDRHGGGGGGGQSQSFRNRGEPRSSSCEPPVEDAHHHFPRRSSNEGMERRGSNSNSNSNDMMMMTMNKQSSRRKLTDADNTGLLTRTPPRTRNDDGVQVVLERNGSDPIPVTRRGCNEGGREGLVKQTSRRRSLAATTSQDTKERAVDVQTFIPDRIIMFRSRGEKDGNATTTTNNNNTNNGYDEASDDDYDDDDDDDDDSIGLEEKIKKCDDDTAINSTDCVRGDKWNGTENTDHARISDTDIGDIT